MKKFDFGFELGFDPAELDQNIKYKGTLLIGPLPVIFTEQNVD